MKKTIITILIVMILLTSTLVNAIPNNSKQEVIGLQNAIENTEGEQKQKLMEVDNKLQEQSRQRIRNMKRIRIRQETRCENDTCNNITILSGEKQELLLGLFKTYRNIEYELEEDGNLERTRKLLDFLWRNIENE